MENKLQCAVSESFQRCGSHHFNLHPSCLSSHSLCFHPQKLSLTHLSLSLSLSIFLWTFGLRILLEPHPHAPWLLKIDYQKTSHTCPDTPNPPMTSYINRVCVLCVCHCLSLPPQMLCRKPVSRGRANALHSLSGSQTSVRWGNCTLQHKQPISRSSASVPTANPGTSLQGTALQHPHSFRKWMLSSPWLL